MFGKAITDKFSGQMKDMNPKIQGADCIPSKINFKGSLPTYNIVKLRTSKTEKSLKAAKEERQIYKGTTNWLTADFSKRTANSRILE